MDPLKPLILLALIASVPCAIAIEKIVVLGLFKGKAIVEIDGRKRSLTAGAMSPEGVRLIAANSSEALIEVNGKPGTYTLGTHIGSTYASVSPQATVQIWPDATGHVYCRWEHQSVSDKIPGGYGRQHRGHEQTSGQTPEVGL
jgi:aspartyl protease family protein